MQEQSATYNLFPVPAPQPPPGATIICPCCWGAATGEGECVCHNGYLYPGELEKIQSLIDAKKK